MNRTMDIEIKVGIFVSVGTVLILLTVLLLGGGRSIFSTGTQYHTVFPQIEGLIEGGVVKLAGVKVGSVDKIKFMHESGMVDVSFTIDSMYKNSIHADASVGIQTQGVLGDRYIVLNTGSKDAPVAVPGVELKSAIPKDLKDYLTDADEILGRLKNSLKSVETILSGFVRDNRSEVFFKNITGLTTQVNEGTKGLNGSMAHVNSIMAKIDRGEGTLGALINDPSLYDDVKSLLGGANRNRVLKYFIKKSVEESREAREAAKDAETKAKK